MKILKIIIILIAGLLIILFGLYLYYFLIPLEKEKGIDAQIEQIIQKGDISLCQKLPDFDMNGFKMPGNYSIDDYRVRCKQRFNDYGKNADNLKIIK